ncbi:lipopolysaccharide biosynthesis protein [Pseudoroseicyclus sp. H15]
MKGEVAAIFALKVAAIGLSVLGLAALARAMDVAQYGAFAAMLSAGLLLSIPLMAGLNLSLLREMSGREGAERLALARHVLARWAPAAATVALLATTLALAAGAAPVGAVATVAAFAALYALSEILQSITRVIDGPVRAFAYREILWRGAVVAVALAALGLGGLTAVQALLCLTAALAGTVALQLATSGLLRGPAQANSSEITATRRRLLREAPSFTLAGSLSTAAPHLVVVLAGLALSLTATAHFFTALKVAMLLQLSVVAMNFVITPRLRAMTIGGAGAADIQAVSRLCAASARVNLAFGATGAALLIPFAGPVLSLFGADFAEAAPTLRILCLAALLNAATGPAGFVMVMFGRQRVFNLVSATSLGLGAMLCLALGRAYGLTGFCWGYVGWAAMQSLGTALAAFGTLQINPTALSRPMPRGLVS